MKQCHAVRRYARTVRRVEARGEQRASVRGGSVGQRAPPPASRAVFISIVREKSEKEEKTSDRGERKHAFVSREYCPFCRIFWRAHDATETRRENRRRSPILVLVDDTATCDSRRRHQRVTSRERSGIHSLYSSRSRGLVSERIPCFERSSLILSSVPFRRLSRITSQLEG